MLPKAFDRRTATFNFFASLISGAVMFPALYLFARWATGADVQMLRVLLNSSKFRTQYDPAKRRDGPAVIRRAV